MHLMINPSKGILLFLCFLCALVAFGQTGSSDTLFLSQAENYSKTLSINLVGVESRLYNGVQYRERFARPNDIGMPYFLSDDWSDGAISYDGEEHENVPLIYDILNEKVIIENRFSGGKLELINEKLDNFSISGHRFVRLHGEVIKDTPISEGFYELLYDGKVKFYVKWQRKLSETILSREVTDQFLETNRYYIYKNGEYIQVKSKASVLSVLQDHKSDLRKYIRKYKIGFRKNREMAIARLTSFYDELGK